jgi:hypothetical protein
MCHRRRPCVVYAELPGRWPQREEIIITWRSSHGYLPSQEQLPFCRLARTREAGWGQLRSGYRADLPVRTQACTEVRGMSMISYGSGFTRLVVTTQGTEVGDEVAGRGQGAGVVVAHSGKGSITMGKHDKKIIFDGRGDFDISKTKDVREAGGGEHRDEDKGDENPQDDQGEPDDQE